MRAERKRVLVIYGDITGFSAWTRRTMPADFLPLMRQVYDIFLMLKADPGLFVKFFGDGFMVVRELPGDKEIEPIMFTFETVSTVARGIERAIQAAEFPRPAGFRSRAVIGPCWRIDYGEHGRERDYLGYFVNFCARLLAISPDEKFLVSDSVRQALERRRSIRVRFKRFEHSAPTPHGVDPEDMKLWSVEFGAMPRRQK